MCLSDNRSKFWNWRESMEMSTKIAMGKYKMLARHETR